LFLYLQLREWMAEMGKRASRRNVYIGKLNPTMANAAIFSSSWEVVLIL